MGHMTGNKTADRVAEINFSGNVIPSVWFKSVSKEDGKPYLLAIMILSEIVYWYRPTEMRDERTGEFIGYKTKFRGELLQKSYRDLADYYQVSKRQVTDAVVFLESLGVIRRVFKTVRDKKGILCNNVLFIDLDPERLKELTYPSGTADTEPEAQQGSSMAASAGQDDGADSSVDNVDNVDKNTPLPRKNVTGSPEKTGEALPKKRETYTEIIKKTNIADLKSISLTDEPDREAIGLMFRNQIGYEHMADMWSGSKERLDVLDACVEIAVSVYFSTGRFQKISGEKRPTPAVRKRLQMLTNEHMQYVVNSFFDTGRKIRNIRGYLLSCMVNSIDTAGVKDANESAMARILNGG